MQKIHYHPSAEDIYALVHPDNPTITLATVYNTLDSFAEAKIISRVLTEEGKNLYVDQEKRCLRKGIGEQVKGEMGDCHMLLRQK